MEIWSVCEVEKPLKTRFYPSPEETLVEIKKEPVTELQLILPWANLLEERLWGLPALFYQRIITGGDWCYFNKPDTRKTGLEGFYSTEQIINNRRTTLYHVQPNGVVILEPSQDTSDTLLEVKGLRPFGIGAKVEGARERGQSKPVLKFIEIVPHFPTTPATKLPTNGRVVILCENNQDTKAQEIARRPAKIISFPAMNQPPA